MNATHTLERQAIAAHRRGDTWADFHRRHRVEMHRTEPIDHRAYHRLVCRLLSLLTSGDTDGMEPAGDAMPWQADDESTKPADVGTAAKINWQAAGIEMEPVA